MLRKAMEDYDAKKFLAKADNLTLGQMLDVWAEEDLKTGSLSNGTVGNYLQAVNRIKQHPIGNRKLKTVTSEHLQKFMDLLAFGGEEGNFKSKGYTIDYPFFPRSPATVLPICSLSKAVHHIQSNAVCGNA